MFGKTKELERRLELIRQERTQEMEMFTSLLNTKLAEVEARATEEVAKVKEEFELQRQHLADTIGELQRQMQTQKDDLLQRFVTTTKVGEKLQKERDAETQKQISRLDTEITLLRATAATLLEVRVDALKATADQLEKTAVTLDETNARVAGLIGQKTVRSQKKTFGE